MNHNSGQPLWKIEPQAMHSLSIGCDTLTQIKLFVTARSSRFRQKARVGCSHSHVMSRSRSVQPTPPILRPAPHSCRRGWGRPGAAEGAGPHHFPLLTVSFSLFCFFAHIVLKICVLLLKLTYPLFLERLCYYW